MRKSFVLAVLASGVWACSGNGGSSSGTGGPTSGSGTTGSSTASSSASSTGSSSGSSGTTGACGLAAAACTPHQPCCTGFLCNSGVCAQAQLVGDPCDPTVGCGNNLNCDTGFCQAPCGTESVCLTLGDACTGTGASTCCPNLSCEDGVCTTAHLPTCGQDGQACATAADCCGNAAAGLQLACVGIPDGGGVCHLGAFGEACDTTRPCVYPLACKPAPTPSNSASSASSTSTTGDSGSSTSDSGSSTSDSGSGTSDSGSTTSDSGSTTGDSGSTTGDSGSTTSDSGSSASDSGSTGSDSGSTGASTGSTGSTGGTVSPGICQYASSNPAGQGTCVFNSPSCFAGDKCNPESDYCSKGGNLVCDANSRTCVPVPPSLLSSCTTSADCGQVSGAAEPLVCNNSNNVFGGSCAAACATDADCTEAISVDQSNSNPPPTSLLCDGTGANKACVPLFCYDSEATPDGSCANPNSSSDPLCGSGISSNPAQLYKACPGHANTLCLPQYFGELSGVYGLCTAVAPAATPSVGKSCDPYAGPATPDLLCGPDALCMGGVCEQICDTQQGGQGSIPACPVSETCVSTQGVNLVSNYQVGGCATPCDPWTGDDTLSGCATFCGGPKAVCEWVLGDRIEGQALGYCRAASAVELHSGDDCSANPNACPQGNSCLTDQSGNSTCYRLCDQHADAGTADSCSAGQTCQTLFNGDNNVGFCH